MNGSPVSRKTILDSLEVYLDAPERGIRGWLQPMEWDVPAYEMNFFQCKVVQDLIHAIEEDRPVGLPPEHARQVVDIMCTIPEAIKTKPFTFKPFVIA